MCVCVCVRVCVCSTFLHFWRLWGFFFCLIWTLAFRSRLTSNISADGLSYCILKEDTLKTWLGVCTQVCGLSPSSLHHVLPWWLSDKESIQSLQYRRHRFNPWLRKSPWRRKWQPSPVFLPGKSHGQKSLACYYPWGCKQSRTWLSNKQWQQGLSIVCYNKGQAVPLHIPK